MSSISEMIKDYIPNTWQYPYNDMIVSAYTNEYKEIQQQLGVHNISRLTRVQNIYSFGQFLIRGQLLIASNGSNYYKVRRFIKVSRCYKDEAIKYNLDPRRCNLGHLQFSKNIPLHSSNDIIVVVQVLTNNQHQDDITPANSLEFYVEYIVEFN